jgi:hypothetical protein
MLKERDMPAKMINIIEQGFLSFWDSCTRPRQLEDGYQIGLLVLIAGGLIKWQLDFPVFSETVLWSGAIILVGSFCWELIKKFRSLLKNATLGTIILGIPSSAVVASIAIVIAERLVNEATLSSPVYFKNSTNIIALLAVPYILAFFFAIGLIIYTIGKPTVWGLKGQFDMVVAAFRKEVTTSSGENHVDDLGRLIASVLLIVSIFWVLDHIDGGSGSALQTFVKYVVLLADHHPHVRCVDVVSEEWYLLIDDNLLSVASIKPEISFSQRTCNPE